MAAVGVVPASCLVLGALLGPWSHIDAWFYAWSLPIACAVSMCVWWWRQPCVLLLVLAIGFFSSGSALAIQATDRALHTSLRARFNEVYGGFSIESIGPAGRHDPVMTRALITEDASPRDGFISLRVEVQAVRVAGEWMPVVGGVVISVNGSAAADVASDWRAGRVIEAPISFRRPARYLNEGISDFERDSALDGITLLGSVKSALLVEVVRRGGPIAEFSAEVRSHVRRAATTWIAPHSPLSAAIATAVLIGDRTGLPAETREALQTAGTYHVIAISGGNIAILASAVSLLLLCVGVRGRLAAATAILILSIYAVVITAGPSVWRATLMAVLYFAARAIDHRSGAWQTASVAAALMIVGRPLDAYDVGFVLTFGATLALLHAARFGAGITSRPLSWITTSIAASIAIEIALLPISAMFFSRVTIAGVVLNLAAVPLMGVVQIAVLVVAVLDSAPLVAGAAAWTAHLAADALVDSAGLVALAPWSSARVAPPHAVIVLAYYAALAALFVGSRRPLRIAATALLGLAALAIVGALDGWIVREEATGRLRLTMLDVGQGESLLLELPSGRKMLIDTGGAPFGGPVDIGARVVAPAVWARGVRSLDTLLITHGDPDHAGGALDVLTDFSPRRLWMGIRVPNDIGESERRGRAAALSIPVQWRNVGDDAIDGEVRLRVLNPPVADWERRRVRNDDSVVLEVLYRDVAMLLTGDISADIERGLLPRLTFTRHRILKVAHHGSRTSSSRELLTAWRPQVALVSAGRGNTFGHPTSEVLRRLHEIGSTVLRTDLDGQITLETDGREVRFSTFIERTSGAPRE